MKIVQMSYWADFRDSALRKPDSPPWSIEPIADDMEIAKAFDLLLRGDGCVKRLERARKKAQEKQAARTDSQRRKEMNAQRGHLVADQPEVTAMRSRSCLRKETLGWR